MASKLNSIAKLIAVNLTVFIVGFITLDLVLGYLKNPYNLNYFRTKHPYYHHGMLPNISQLTAWGVIVYEVRTNSLGFIDSTTKRVPLKKNEGTKRILLLGDSHTEGVGIAYKNTFSGILARELAPLRYEILNASAVSYSPKIHLLKADHLLNNIGLEVDEIWVFIDISDLQNEIAYKNFTPVKPKRLYLASQRLKKIAIDKSFAANTLHRRREALKTREFLEKMFLFNPQKQSDAIGNAVDLYRDFFRDFDDDDLLRSPSFHGVSDWYYNLETMELAYKGLELGQANIEKLNALCKQHNIKLRLGVHPWHPQIHKGDTSDIYVDSWRQFCESHSIDFINLFPLFINEEKPSTIIWRYYINRDNHWNEAGHQKVAEHLLSLIIQ